MINGKNILVIVAHPDDETIGCGGSIAKLSRTNHIKLIIMTTGNTGVDTVMKIRDIVSKRKKEANAVFRLLGVGDVSFLNNKTQELEWTKENLWKLTSIIRAFRPDIIVTHSKCDKHRDHRITSTLVTEAAWKSGENIMPQCGKPIRITEVWAMEITDPFTPDLVVGFSAKELAIKVNCLREYNSQKNILPRIQEYCTALATVRGYQANCDFGEGFKRISKEPSLR